MKPHRLAFVTVLIWTALASADDAAIVKQLRPLKPLQKVHYSYPLPFAKLSDELLIEYARVTQALSVHARWTTKAELDRVVSIIAKVRKAGINPTLAINYDPYVQSKISDPTDPRHRAEIDIMRARFKFVADTVGERVKVTAVLFDCEAFQVRENDAWKRALDDLYDLAYLEARSRFREARIVWYGRGAIQPSQSSTGWSAATNFTLRERGDSFSCSLYYGSEQMRNQQVFRSTVANAEKHGVKEVVPWIALAAGYIPDHNSRRFSLDWQYPTIYSWWLGAQVNRPYFAQFPKRFGPFGAAKIAVFYPEPFGRVPTWPEHFVAYVKGANLIAE